MRLINTMAVLLLVVGFPTLSWYYLGTGANWRLAGLEQLEPEGIVQFDSIVLRDGAVIGSDQITDMFMLVTTATAAVAQPELQGIHEQYGYRDDLLMLNIGDEVLHIDDWRTVDCKLTDCVAIRQAMGLFNSANLAFLDRDQQLRNSYQLPDDISSVIREAAILLPTEKRENIELKRGEVN